MKKPLNYLGPFLFFLAFFLVGVFFIGSILQLASYPYDLILTFGIAFGFIYLSRNEKDGLVHIFRDIHQSNLDDIEAQESEEK